MSVRDEEDVFHDRLDERRDADRIPTPRRPVRDPGEDEVSRRYRGCFGVDWLPQDAPPR
jgi:hypothetical protein